MAYNNQTGQTGKTQKGGVFEGGQLEGVTGTAQKGGIFDGIVVVKGDQGPVGPPGPPGGGGGSGTIAVGSTTTLPAGQPAYVTDTGTSTAAIFNFGIPQGPQGTAGLPGPTGPAIVVTANATATSLQAGSPATATVTTTFPGPNIENLAFALGIPTGPSGPAGAPGPALTVGTVNTTTGNAGTQANVTISQPINNALNFGFTIPQGVQGQMGQQGAPGPQGVSITGITASATTTNNVVTVVLNETYSAGADQQTSFQFSSGGSGSGGIFFGIVDPSGIPTTIPAIYLNTVTKNLFFYPNTTIGWLEVAADSTLTSNNGTIAVTPTSTGYSVDVAQQSATDLQKLTWNTAANNWRPQSTTVTSNVSSNNATVTVDGQGTTFSPVQTVGLGFNNNQLTATVNGVSSTPLTIDTVLSWQLAGSAQTGDVNTINLNNSLSGSFANGILTVNSTGGAGSTGSPWFYPSPVVTGLKTYTIPSGYSTTTAIVTLNGTILRADLDYSIAGITLTISNTVAIIAGDIIGISATGSSVAGGVTSIIAGSNVTISPVSGVGDVTINATGGAAGFVNLTEPTWRTVMQSSVGNTENITVTDNAQVPTQFFAGTNIPVFTYTNPTQAQLGLSQAGSQVIITGVGIDGVFSKVFSTQLTRTPDQAYLDCQNPLTGNFWYAQSSYPASGIRDFWQPTQPPGTTNHIFTYQRSLNGTRNPIHSDAFLSIRFVGFTGGTLGNTTTIFGTLNNASSTPTFRPLYMPDIEPLFTPGSYPDTGQVATWQDGAAGNTGTISWITPVPPVIPTTTVVGIDGVVVTSSQMGNNTEWVVKAALEAQNNGTAVQGTFFDINAGTNLNASITNNILTLNNPGLTAQDNTTPQVGTFYTINAGQGISATVAGNVLTLTNTGGGGGGDLAVTSAWSSGGASKQAYTSPNVVNTQGVTLSLTATTNVGPLTNAFVKFNGVLATGTYVSTGTFPNYTIMIPANALPALAQTTASVLVEVDGVYQGLTSIFMGGTLINVQPENSVGTLTVTGQTLPARAYYTPAPNATVTATIMATNNGTVNGGTTYVFDGTGPTNNNTASLALGPHTVRAQGSVAGRFGAATNVAFDLTGSVTTSQAVYTPAFYLQTSGPTAAQPTFLSTSPQSPGEGAGGPAFMYPAAPAQTAYNWVLTNRPITNVFIRTPFGDTQLSPDVTATQTLAGTTTVLNLYGWTKLGVGQRSTLIIT